jgi:hypothetical protein
VTVKKKSVRYTPNTMYNHALKEKCWLKFVTYIFPLHHINHCIMSHVIIILCCKKFYRIGTFQSTVNSTLTIVKYFSINIMRYVKVARFFNGKNLRLLNSLMCFWSWNSSVSPTFYQNYFEMRTTADVTGGKPIAVWTQSISGVSAIILMH